MQEIIEEVRSFDGVLVVAPEAGSDFPELSWGDAYFYHAPDGRMPERTQPYGTIITKDYPDDTSSALDAPGRFRVNIHVGRERAESIIAAGSLTGGDTDPTAVDVFRPHPLYGTAGWVCVINPAAATEGAVLALLREAHEAARALAPDDGRGEPHVDSAGHDSSGHDRDRPSDRRGVGGRLRRARAAAVRDRGPGRRPCARCHRQDARLRAGRAHGCGRDPSSLRRGQGCSQRRDPCRHRRRPLRGTGRRGRAHGCACSRGSRLRRAGRRAGTPGRHRRPCIRRPCRRGAMATRTPLSRSRCSPAHPPTAGHRYSRTPRARAPLLRSPRRSDPRDPGTPLHLILDRFSPDSASTDHTGGMRILVVDDEVRLAEGVRRGLEAEGFAVDVAHNGVDGLWRARETRYDAIVLDLMMPGMSGWKVCEALRAEENWTPVLMLTAKDGEWDQVEALETGADDYVTKPFSFAILVARLRALVRRGAVARPAILEAGDLRLDPAAHRVWRGETPVSLTAREFSVLEYLMRHRGQVLSKRALIDGVWDDDFDGDPNIVEVYVGHLRRKLDKPFGREAIETIRGAGYRLAANGG